MTRNLNVILGSALAQSRNKCMTVLEKAEDEKLSIFVEAVEAAGLDGILDDGNTIFAPSDRAFTAALKSLKLKKEELFDNKKFLTEILSYHVLPTAYSSEELISLGADGFPFTTFLAGDSSCDVEAVTLEVSTTSVMLHLFIESRTFLCAVGQLLKTSGW